MTNEELVKQIQNGEREYIEQLWEQVADLVRYLADKHLLKYPSHYQQYHEDMVQQSYFYFLKAIEGYQEEKGSFTSYLSYYVRNAFNEVLQGRSIRQQNEPLNNALSVDLPLSDTEDLTLAEMLIDDTAEGYYRRLEDEDFWLDVGRVLHKAVDVVSPDYQEFFHTMIDHGTGVTDTLRIMGVSLKEKDRYYSRYREGLYKMRRYLRGYIRKTKDIALEECISYYTGVGSWKNRQYTSVVEQAVIRHNDRSMTTRAVGEVLALQP